MSHILSKLLSILLRNIVFTCQNYRMYNVLSATSGIGKGTAFVLSLHCRCRQDDMNTRCHTVLSAPALGAFGTRGTGHVLLNFQNMQALSYHCTTHPHFAPCTAVTLQSSWALSLGGLCYELVPVSNCPLTPSEETYCSFQSPQFTGIKMFSTFMYCPCL